MNEATLLCYFSLNFISVDPRSAKQNFHVNADKGKRSTIVDRLVLTASVITLQSDL